jgi:phosphatidylglycerophosphate synthase
MVGEVSEDGNWVWNGDEWVPNTSEPEPPIQSTASENVEPSVEASSTPVPLPVVLSPGNSLPLPAFNPNFQFPLPVSQGSQVPIVMRTLSGVTSIFMSIVLLLFITGFVIGVNSDNIESLEQEKSSGAEAFADAIGTVQMLTFLSVGIVVGILVMSVLSFVGKAKWWWLAAAITILSLLFTITAFYIAGATNDYNDTCDTEYYDCSGITEETAFDQDAMISGYCSFFALLLVGIFSLIQRSTSMGKSQTQPVQVGGVENKQPMNKMLVLAVVLIVLAAGVALSFKSPSGEGIDSEPDEYYSFGVVDAWDAEPMDDGGDNALIVVRMIDTNGRLEHYEMVDLLMVMSDGTPARCYWSGLDRDSFCEFDELDADGDMRFGVGDGLLVYEKGEDLCSGGTESNPVGCEIDLSVRIGNAMGDMSYMSDTLSGYADPVDED